MHRETFIEKLTEIQQNVDFLLSQVQASEHDKFAAHLYRSRRNTAQLAIDPAKAESKSNAA
jgi:hypothetical protein